LKPEHSTAARSMRAVSLVIVLVTVVTLFAVVYSAYEDASALTSVKSGSSAASSKTVVIGNDAEFFLNITLANAGILPFQAQVTCSAVQPSVSCTPASLTVNPGTSGTLHFEMTVNNYAQLENSTGGLNVNGTMTFGLVPFASLSVALNFGSFISHGGG